jgi:group I intron endonuclease
LQSGVYLIVNTKTGTVYVGSATNVDRRIAQHRGDLNAGRHSVRALQRDWNHFGSDCFTFNPIETVGDPSQLQMVEQRWIDHYKTTHGLQSLYNLQLTVPPRVNTTTIVEPEREKSQKGKVGLKSCGCSVLVFLLSGALLSGLGDIGIVIALILAAVAFAYVANR